MVQHADIDHTGLTGVGETGTAAHIADAADAHDASAISVLDTATNFTGTDVEAVLAELQDNIDAVGGGGALTLIDTQTVAGSDATITFSSIPNTYNDLVIIGRVRDDAASVVVAQGLQMQVGAGSVDTGATAYAWHAYDAGASADTFAVDNSDSKALLARAINGNSATAGSFSPVQLEIFDYADVSVCRAYICTVGLANASDSRSGRASGAWLNTASAIDIITIQGASGGNLKIGSKLRLYGRL
jgi:hypothetical protein